MILHLVRHLPPDIAAGHCYGRLDVGAKNDPAAVTAIRAALPADLPLWTSPSRRCLTLAAQLHAAPLIDARLREMDFGDWEGRPWDDIGAAALDAWAADVADFAPPGGESARAVQTRALAFVGNLAVPAAILVTHAGVIRVLQAWCAGADLARCLDYRPAYASVTTLQLPR
jgi:alpha-ribazole phosphatase